MDKVFRTKLNNFHGAATKATYAGGGGKVESWRKGFSELEYTDKDWYYRDSYAGFLRSWGQEVIWYKNKPIWNCLYGGGMTEDRLNLDFANQTFIFLKKVLSSGNKERHFQPRGPKDFVDGDWQYRCDMHGTIETFSGHEEISYKGSVVFTHVFMGGLVIGEDED